MTVFRKELRETLRDRRTLLVMVVVPVFLYPVLLVVHRAAGALRAAADRGRSRPRWRWWAARPALADFLAARHRAAGAAARPRCRSARWGRGRWTPWWSSSRPPRAPRGTSRARVLYDASRDRSRRARDLVRARLEAVGRHPARAAAGGARAPGLLRRARWRSPTARWPARSGWAATPSGASCPLLLILMTLLGAFYPAIDLTAGEKERGTLETLLTAPVPGAGDRGGEVPRRAALLAARGGARSTWGACSSPSSRASSSSPARPGAGVQPPAARPSCCVLLFLVPLAVLLRGALPGASRCGRSRSRRRRTRSPRSSSRALVPTYLPLIPGIPLSATASRWCRSAGVAVLFRDLMAGERAARARRRWRSARRWSTPCSRCASPPRAFGREDVLFGGGGGERAPPGRAARAAARLARAGRAASRGRRRPSPSWPAWRCSTSTSACGCRSPDLERGLLASQWLLLALPAVLFVAARGRTAPRRALALRPAAARAPRRRGADHGRAASRSAGCSAGCRAWCWTIPEAFLQGFAGAADGATRPARFAVAPPAGRDHARRSARSWSSAACCCRASRSELPLARAVLGSPRSSSAPSTSPSRR